MKYISVITCFVFLLATQAYADVEEEQPQPEPATAGEGVILEFDRSIEDYEKEKEETAGEKTRRRGGIEMIVGGQGEDGIAKRKRLQIID